MSCDIAWLFSLTVSNCITVDSWDTVYIELRRMREKYYKRFPMLVQGLFVVVAMYISYKVVHLLVSLVMCQTGLS